MGNLIFFDNEKIKSIINEYIEISLLVKDDPINLKHQIDMIHLLTTQLNIRKNKVIVQLDFTNN